MGNRRVDSCVKIYADQAGSSILNFSVDSRFTIWRSCIIVLVPS